MFCPKCESEYVPGFTRCKECDVDLVPNLPQSAQSEAKNIEYEELLSTYSPSDVAIIKSLLEGEGITYFFQGETVGPYIFFALPMRLLVRKDQVETAAEVLKDLQLSVIYSGLHKRKHDENT